MKSTTQLTKLLLSAMFLVAFATLSNAQLDHQMIFRANSPAVVAGDYTYGAPALDAGNPATQWGPTSINTVTGDLAWISDGVDSLGCSPAINTLTGKVALVRRGICNFSLKVYHAQQAGAVGCVICNHTPGAGTVGMLGGDSMSAVTIPSVFLSYEDCELLHQQVDAGTTTNVSFYVPTVYNATTSFAYNTPAQHIQTLNNINATVYNTSTSSASNVVVTARIVDPVGSTQLLSETITTLPGTYDSLVVFATPYTPAAVGQYDVIFKSSLNPFDSVVQSFNINNDSTFALDNNNFTPSGNLGGIGPNDADYAAADPATGATYFYEMGATYLTGIGTQSDATSATFALQNANQYFGKDFIVLLYEQPAAGFTGQETDYSTFGLIGGGLYTVTAADTAAPHMLMNTPLFDISTGFDTVAITGDKQYMLVLRHAGDGSVITSPKISYTHIQDYLSIAATTYVDRLYMAGWNPSYAPVIRLHVQPMGVGTAVDPAKLNRNEAIAFPNPTDRFVSLKLNLENPSENVIVKLVNLNGKVLQEHSYNNIQDATYTYNVEDLAAGVYLMHIQTDNGQSLQKVVIK